MNRNELNINNSNDVIDENIYTDKNDWKIAIIKKIQLFTNLNNGDKQYLLVSHLVLTIGWRAIFNILIWLIIIFG